MNQAIAHYITGTSLLYLVANLCSRLGSNCTNFVTASSRVTCSIVEQLDVLDIGKCRLANIHSLTPASSVTPQVDHEYARLRGRMNFVLVDRGTVEEEFSHASLPVDAPFVPVTTVSIDRHHGGSSGRTAWLVCRMEL